MLERILYKHCPLCESTNIKHIRTGNCSHHPLYDPKLSPDMLWKQCSDCMHIFTEGYFTEEACRIIFGKTQAVQKVGGPVEQNRVISSRMVEKVLPYASDGIWLDVGFGNGSLLFTAQEYGFTPLGVDLRKDNVTTMNSLGIEAHCVDISQLSLSGKCSVISMADVLEHMPYPKTGLIAANNLLRNGGVLLISMPNCENVLWRLTTAENVNPYWGEIEHYHNFSRSGLYSLLEAHGFKAVRYGISERYRICMEVVALKRDDA